MQLLVCGRAEPADAYAAACAKQMAALRLAHPTAFWAEPHAYYTGGALASLGADFGVMPSVYEPYAWLGGTRIALDWIGLN